MSQITMTLAPTTTLALRDYQTQAVDALVAGSRAGHTRQILCAPTGAGKSEIAVHLIERAQDKGLKIAFIADRVVLVEQFSERLSNYGILHGIAQADNTRGRSEPIQVCSAQTVEKRGFLPNLDMLIIDEAHHQRAQIIDFAKKWGGPVVGLTATPLTPGLGKNYSGVVNATTTDALLADGWLAPLRIYAAAEIDMDGAKKTAGEWQDSEVRERARPILGDIVSEWVRHTLVHFGGPAKTLVFSADVAHGEEICAAFQAAGYDFRQTSYRDTTDETRRLIDEFRRDEYVGLCSVSKLTKGFDVPDVRVGVDARPNSSSVTEVIQKMGRVMRSSPGKEYGIWLDHAGNMAGWYEDIVDFWAQGVERLDDGKKAKKKTRREGEERKEVVCKCGYIMLPGAQTCLACGRERRRRTKAVVRPATMEEIVASGSREWQKNKEWTWQHISRLALERRRGDWEAARKTASGYYKGLYKRWPSQKLALNPCEGPVDPRVQRKINANIRQYYKGR